MSAKDLECNHKRLTGQGKEKGSGGEDVGQRAAYAKSPRKCDKLVRLG